MSEFMLGVITGLAGAGIGVMFGMVIFHLFIRSVMDDVYERID